jgi:hypothetical protein
VAHNISSAGSAVAPRSMSSDIRINDSNESQDGLTNENTDTAAPKPAPKRRGTDILRTSFDHDPWPHI